MTLEEAIRHCEEVAEQNEQGLYDAIALGGQNPTQEEIANCEQCAADHRQLAEWLTDYKKLRDFNDKVYDVLAKQFGCPCNCNYAVDAHMRQNGGCDDCGVEISDKECWSRYIQTKLINDEK